MRVAATLACLAATVLPPSVHARVEAPRVVLLHGLARTTVSMQPMERALRRAGYEVCNVSYPSRSHRIEALAASHVAPAIARCFDGRQQPLHFVTYSLGGVIVRQLAEQGLVGQFGRVVMVAPPNHGSEVVDRLGSWPLFRMGWGQAARQLGTSAEALPSRLGPAPFEVGVIAGSGSINPYFSSLIPGDDDGTVSVASTRLEGMDDFIVLPVSHTFLATDRRAIDQALAFLADGRFRPTAPARRPGT